MPHITRADKLTALQTETTPPHTPRITPIADGAALPAPPLHLPPSSASSSSSSSPFSSLHIGLSPSLPRVVITLADPMARHMPWRPCQLARPTYNPTHLTPPAHHQVICHRMRLEPARASMFQAQGERQRGREQYHDRLQTAKCEREEQLQRQSFERMPADQREQELRSRFRSGKVVANFDLLRPVGRDLVAWRLLSFYSAVDVEDFAFCARFRILSRGVDWKNTWKALREQQRRYQKRRCRAQGLLPVSIAMWRLDLLSVIHAVADDVGIPAGQLMLGIEAFATHFEPVRRLSARNLAEQKRWEYLARILLEDREYLTQNLNAMLFPHERVALLNDLFTARQETEKKYLSVLEYEEDCCASLFCCLPNWQRKRKLFWKLSAGENAQLDGALELQVQMASAFPPQMPKRRVEEEVRSSSVPGVQSRKKSVRTCIEEQELRASSGEDISPRTSWDSREEIEKRRKERREFIFGNEEDQEEEAGDLEKKERKRKQPLDRVLAANAKRDQEYAVDAEEGTDYITCTLA